MKRFASISTAARGFIIALFSLLLAAAAPAQTPTASTNGNDALLGERVRQLLESRNVGRFADEFTASVQDWRGARLANTAPNDGSADSELEQKVAYERQTIADSAQLMLDQAARLGLDPARVRFRVKQTLAAVEGTWESQGIKLPGTTEIKVVLEGGPARNAEADKSLRGEYELTLGGGLKFPGGWRLHEGIRWNRFPNGVADAAMLRDLAVISKVASHPRQLTDVDDPALAALGQTLIQFLQKRDGKIFTSAAMRSLDEVWKEFEAGYRKNFAGKDLPPRKELEEAWGGLQTQVAGSARNMLNQAGNFGIDFSGADITLQNAVAENPNQRGVFGAVKGIDANPIWFKFSVQSDHKSKAGRPISGEYYIVAGRGQRSASRWTIEDKIRWEKFPDGLLGPKELEELAVQNYMVDNGFFLPGTVVPDVEFVRLDSAAKGRLSDYRGKVVILDFWATWCVPCQVPMAHLQTLRQECPDWKDRVEIISLSIDEELAQVRRHLAARGWTNTFNTWAGPGGWLSTPARQFNVHMVPTLYVIDAEGKVVQAGHFSNSQLTNLVASALK